MSLKKASVSGIKWSSVSQIGRLIMQLCTMIILARLLSPKDFGLMGMATIVTTFIGLFSNLGTAPAVVQIKEPSKAFLSSIFWINLAIGLLTTILLFLISPLVANVYYEPRITVILRVLSLSFVISSLSILQRAIQERNLAFNTLAKIEICSILIGSITGVGMALSGWGVWSLIFQSLVVSLITTILLWFSSQWRPSLVFQWSEINSVVSFSLNLTASGVLFYLIRNVDNFLIGTFLGAEALGFYTMAYRLMLYPIQNIAGVVQRVIFPIFSIKQDDNEWLSYTSCKVTNMIALIVFPVVIGLTVLCELFVMVVFGSRWSSIIPLIIILLPAALVESIEPIVSVIYQSKGRTDLMFRFSIITGVFCLIAFLIGVRWGLIGVCIAYVCTLPLSLVNFVISFRLIKLSTDRFLLALWNPFLNSLLMGVAILSLKLFLLRNFSISNISILMLLSSIGCAIYLSINWYFNREQMQEILSLLKPTKRMFKKGQG